MNYYVFGFKDEARKTTPIYLYSGSDRAEATKAMEKGGKGILCTVVFVDPIPHQSRRFPVPAVPEKGGTGGSPVKSSAPGNDPESPPE